jgi:glycosyltransferase involved in cell wall biosynthesis
MPSVSIILSTYNSPAWLEKVIWGYLQQTFRDFEIVIADDGSKDDTRQLIHSMAEHADIPLLHVWQEDNGFQKNRALNKAIAACRGDYLIFSDGDCIPRKDFVAQHVSNSAKDRFLSGGYFKLPMAISRMITRQDIEAQHPFDVHWLRQRGLKRSPRNLKLTHNAALGSVLNRLVVAAPSWNGHNASCHKEHLFKINGFNEDMAYGGEDRELGDRLMNYGLKPRKIRYSAVLVHLDHPRGYVDPEIKQRNHLVRMDTIRNRVIITRTGLDQHLTETP